jgi:hypothetical protein
MCTLKSGATGGDTPSFPMPLPFRPDHLCS